MRWNFVKRLSSAIQFEIYEVQHSIVIAVRGLHRLKNVAKRYMSQQLNF